MKRKGIIYLDETYSKNYELLFEAEYSITTFTAVYKRLWFRTIIYNGNSITQAYATIKKHFKEK